MDIAQRTMETNPINMDENAVIGFDRKFETKELMVNSLTKAGYEMQRVDKWLLEGRVREINDENKTWWSDVNPEARMLYYEYILSNECGKVALQNIASNASTFPCYLMVAEIGSACREDSIQEMKSILKNRLFVKSFEGASHSIHNSAQDEFLSDLQKIISEQSTTD